MRLNVDRRSYFILFSNVTYSTYGNTWDYTSHKHYTNYIVLLSPLSEQKLNRDIRTGSIQLNWVEDRKFYYTATKKIIKFIIRQKHGFSFSISFHA